ncbi:phosphatase PAP2 family protein [Hymenobacter elongatus]|uniref:Phosphatase PAP2 family protein n=1 Tax=Hymenobacter elongatus TaxID=877208 RepID=A0A4Z0PMG4_9BACT|nr:phosphatase PAP2 family protein [Hymenobacter elongatus]TGE16788.1 phosphatase PAP2 family protein [Hymenobacter elongatus]
MLYPVLLTTRRFLWLTALLVPLCGLLIVFIDQPLARFCHAHSAGLKPFFGGFTGAAEVVHEATMKTRLFGIPALFVALVLLYAVGRWLLKLPQASVFLVVVVAHLASVGTSNVLKGVVSRLRPEVLFSTGYPDWGFNYPHHAHAGSFPSTHTATFFSLFVPLALAFPRLSAPLLVVPVLIGVGRLVLEMHYLSDVLFSVWLVVLFTFLAGQLAHLPLVSGRHAALAEK